MQDNKIIYEPSYLRRLLRGVALGLLLAFSGCSAVVIVKLLHFNSETQKSADAYKQAAQLAVAASTTCEAVTYVIEGTSPTQAAKKLGALGKEIEHQRLALLLAQGGYKP